jgi:hypothetical protein
MVKTTFMGRGMDRSCTVFGAEKPGFSVLAAFSFSRRGFFATKPAFLERISLTRGGGPG